VHIALRAVVLAALIFGLRGLRLNPGGGIDGTRAATPAAPPGL